MSTALQITLEEFLARPGREDHQREELVEGELIVSPGAKPAHAAIVDRLRDSLALLRQQGFVLANDFSCILGQRSMPVPDLAAVRMDRWNQAVRNDDWLQGSPDLVIEIASPSNRKLQFKASVYLEHGAEQVWTVYPKTMTVAVATSRNIIQARVGDLLEFHGVAVPVASLFTSA